MPVAHWVVIPRPWNHRWPTGDDVSSSPRYSASWVPPGVFHERWRGWIKLLGLKYVYSMYVYLYIYMYGKKTLAPQFQKKWKRSHRRSETRNNPGVQTKEKCKILFCWTVFNLNQWLWLFVHPSSSIDSQKANSPDHPTITLHSPFKRRYYQSAVEGKGRLIHRETHAQTASSCLIPQG